MIQTIKTIATNNYSDNLSFKGINAKITNKYIANSIKNYNKIEDKNNILEYITKQFTAISNFIKSFIKKDRNLPFVNTPLIAPADATDNIYIKELNSLADDAKRYGLRDLYNNICNTVNNAEKNSSVTTGGWSSTYLSEIKTRITDLKNDISNAKSTGQQRNYFEENNQLSFGNQIEENNLVTNTLQDIHETILDVSTNTEPSIDALNDNFAAIDLNDAELNKISDVSKIETLPDFSEIKDYASKLFSDFSDSIDDIWQTIKEELSG